MFASSLHRAAAVFVALALASGTAFAAPEDLDASHKAAAQDLFEDGRRLMSLGEYEEALRSLTESQRLDPALGTRFNMAECYEKLGKLASAWAHYVAVADGSERLDQMKRAAIARAKADELEPQLARIRIEVTKRHEGLVVSRNGSEVGSAQWSKHLPVDTGAQTIEASAPDHESWRQTIEVPDNGAELTVTIPSLVPVVLPPVEPPPPSRIEPVSAAPDTPPPPPPRSLTGQQIGGIVLTSVGVVSLGIGGAFGIVAKQRNDDAEARCPTPETCFADGAQLVEDARRAGNVSTALFVVGGVLVATGVIVLVTGTVAKKRLGRVRAGAGLQLAF